MSTKRVTANNSVLKNYEKNLISEISTVLVDEGVSFMVSGYSFSSLLKLLPNHEQVMDRLNLTLPYFNSDKEELMKVKINNLISNICIILDVTKDMEYEEDKYFEIIFFFNRLLYCLKAGYYLNYIIYHNRDKFSEADLEAIKKLVDKKKLTFSQESKKEVLKILSKICLLEDRVGSYVSYKDLYEFYN